MGLGRYPSLDLKKARAAAFENRIQVLKGDAPLAKRQAEQAAQKEAERREQAKQITFETLANDYCLPRLHPVEKWRKGWLRKLELYAFPYLGKLSADEIDT